MVKVKPHKADGKLGRAVAGIALSVHEFAFRGERKRCAIAVVAVLIRRNCREK
jgi:hypothetical protein